MGKKTKAPKAPDYAALAKTDAAENRQTAQELTRWNRPTQIDAYGNTMKWTEDGNGNWTQQVTQNPLFTNMQNQAIFGSTVANNAALQNTMKGFQGQALGNLDQGSTAGVEGALKNASSGDFTNTAGEIGNFDRSQGDRVANDFYESIMGRARPEQQREQSALDVQLRQQGLQPGTEAYNRAMTNMMTAHGDVATKAGLDATQAGYNAARDIYGANLAGQGQRYQQLADTYGINQAQDWNAVQGELSLQDLMMQRNNQQMSANNQRFNQELRKYQLPMEQAAAYQSLWANSPRPEFAGFSGATGYNPADMMGAAQAGYQAQMGGYNSGQNKKNNLVSSGATLGAGYLMSDESLKEDVHQLSGKVALAAILGMHGYSFRWRADGKPDMGLMAQQVQRIMPELVQDLDGKLAVHYSKVVAMLVAAVDYLAEELKYANRT